MKTTATVLYFNKTEFLRQRLFHLNCNSRGAVFTFFCNTRRTWCVYRYTYAGMNRQKRKCTGSLLQMTNNY